MARHQPKPTISAVVAGKVIAYGASRGVPLAELIAIAGLSAGALTDVEHRIPISAFDDLLAHVARRLDDPGAAIHYAAQARSEDFHVMGFAAMTSMSVRESIARVCRYMVLMTDASHWEFDGVTDPAAPSLIRYRTPCFTAGTGLFSECVIAMYLQCLRRSVRVDFSPIRVTFRHAAPRDTVAHRDFFRCPVEFGAPRDSFAFSPTLLNTVPYQANPALSAFFTHHAERVRGQHVSEARLFAERAHDAVAQLLSSGEPSVGGVARQLGTSERTLRRHLEHEGTTFRQIVDDARRQIAEQLLGESTASISEIASLLGFSDATTFTRAFKRWCGKTPGSLREELRAARGGLHP